MNLKTAILTYILQIPAISDMLNNKGFPNVAPETSQNPNIITRVIGDSSYRNMTGPTKLSQIRLQVIIYTDKAQTLDFIKDTIRTALDGAINYTIQNGVSVRTCTYTDNGDDYYPPTDGSQYGDFYDTLDFLIWYDLP